MAKRSEKKREIKDLEAAVVFLFEIEEKLMALSAAVTAAVARLDASFTTLSADVATLKASADASGVAANDAAVAKAVNDAADKVDALDATIKPPAV